MKITNLINIATVILLSTTIFLYYQLNATLNKSSEEIVKVTALSGLISGITTIAILIQIISSNMQLKTIFPSIKILDSRIEYETTKIIDIDVRITKMYIFLNLLNESSSPVSIDFFKIRIGKFDPFHSYKFNVNENNKITFYNNLIIPPHQPKSFQLIEDMPGMSSPYFVPRIEEVNNKKLDDIYEIEIELIGNFGVKSGKIYFRPYKPRPGTSIDLV
jgi:hypothetical protein